MWQCGKGRQNAMRLTRRKEKKKRKTEVERRDFVWIALSRLQAWILARKSRYSFMSTLRNFHAENILSTGGGMLTVATVIYTTDALMFLTRSQSSRFDNTVCLLSSIQNQVFTYFDIPLVGKFNCIYPNIQLPKIELIAYRSCKRIPLHIDVPKAARIRIRPQWAAILSNCARKKQLEVLHV